MSLQDPTQKMSKSHKSAWSRILITDEPEEIRKKIMGAVTDPENYVSYDPLRRPGVSNLLRLMACFDKSKRTPEELGSMLSNENLDLRGLKERVSESIVSGLGDIRDQYIRILAADDGKFIDQVSREGAAKARARASKTMELVRQAVGL